ncbi:MAG: XRE family transcriptional regulator [Lactobacillus sp.]|nr:MAG: XRE family transcriptional regulator [Lactobacillus sp.]
MTEVHYFGPNLKRLRLQSGLSQPEICAALVTPVNGQAISNWEREINHPTCENLIGIAKFFNVMPSELLRTEKRPQLEKPRPFLIELMSICQKLQRYAE